MSTKITKQTINYLKIFQYNLNILYQILFEQMQKIVDMHPPTTLIIEMDNGNFNIQKDKVMFLKENSKVRFVASSTLNARYTPFLLTDRKVKISSHQDCDIEVKRNITFGKEDFRHKYKLIPGHIKKSGHWVAEETFKFVGPISMQMIFCEVTENELKVRQFGEQEYFIVEPESFRMDNLIVMSVLPRCIGRFEKWKEFFERQVSLGYNAFHLPPIQELGMSRSYYSISNQHELSEELFHMPNKYQALERFIKQFNKNGVTFFVDIVLNHTSNTSQWIKDDPVCVFTVENTPMLNSTLLVDCAVFEWGEKIKKGELEGFNKLRIENQDDLNFLKASLIKVLEELKVWEYFQLREQIVQEMFQMVKPSPPSINIFIEDPSVQIQKIMSKNIVDLGVGRYMTNIVNLTKDWTSSGIKYEKNDLIIARDNINREWKDKVNGWIYNDIPNSIIEEIRYKYIIEKQGHQEHQAFVKRSFSLINENTNTYALNNGWVAGYASSEEDMITSLQFYYFRRKVNIWADLVKLRYGQSKHATPKLWKHMRKYVEIMAKYFNGFRIDNCHNTPIHVGQYFIKKARKVNHSLIVFAELFTNSKEKDSIYIKKMGINALVKEAIHSLDSARFVSSFYSNAGVNSVPLGALNGSLMKNGEKRIYIKPRRPQYLVYELTHDNHTYVEKQIEYKQLPVMVLLSFLGSPVGTNKGFDQYYMDHISVTQRRQLYQEDKLCEQRVFKNPKIKIVITYQDKVPSKDSKVQVAGTWTDWKPVDMKFNQRYYYLECLVDNGNYEFKFVVDGVWLSQTRRPKADVNGNHQIQASFESPRRTSYTNLEGVRSSLSILKDRFQYFGQVYLKSEEGTVQIVREDHQSKKRYIFVIANLSDTVQFGKYKLIGSITSATIWVRIDGKIVESSSVKEFFDVEPDGKDTVLSSAALPVGFSCVIETQVNIHVVEAIQKLQQIIKQPFVFENKFSVFDVSTLMFSSSREEEVIRGSANYVVPGQGQLPYGGLGSLYNLLKESIRQNNLLIPLYDNIIQGDWLFDYILNRINNQPQFKNVHDRMKECFGLLKNIPRHQIPHFFSQFICGIVNSLRSTLDYGTLKISKSSFADNLVLASHQFFNNMPCKNPEYKVCMAAGLPHFTTGWARSWGRDTFISIQLLLLHPELCKQNILNFAKNLRHGLIPNLLDHGHHPRYNCRDAAWWFIRAVKEYAQHTGDYNIFQETVEMNFLSSDIDEDAYMKSRNQKVEKSIQNIIQQIFQTHADGIEFREWRAGVEIDSSMASEGFNIELSVDPDTGFIVGGNGRNCLTWMDKMGSMGKTKGVPATSRNGSPVELVGLLHHNLIAYNQLFQRGVYKHNSVEFKKKTFRYVEWAAYIKLHFEQWFWIPADLTQNTHKSIESHFIKRRGIYKDVIKSSNLPEQQYRLRPNALITLALSPSLVKPEHALLYIENVEKNLIKPDSIGIGTLDKIHESLYSEEYDNDLDSPEFKKAFGFSYHNGPEWVWLYGFYIKALLNFKKIPKQQASALLQDHIAYIRKDIWMSLPELTNVNGKYNRFSCSAQAWSISSLLLALQAIEDIE